MAGRIAPDGRPPQAPGVGKDAKRHDLEAPATPGVRNSDMQQGDRQRLEAAQQIAPRPKKGSPQGGGGSAAGGGPMQVPDPIEFAGQRIGGQSNLLSDGSTVQPLDVERWKPLLNSIARNPQASGPLTTSILTQLSNLRQVPSTAHVRVIDQNAADEAIRESL